MNDTIATIPVSSSLILRDNSTAIVGSLFGLASNDRITVALPPPVLPINAEVRLISQVTSASAAVQAGYEGLVNFNAEASATYMLGDVRAVTTRANTSGGIIVNEVWGVSYRFVIKAWNLKASGAASISSIAADTTINGSGSAFQAEVIGIQAGDLVAEVPALSAVMGAFDMTQYQQLGTIQTQLNDYIINFTDRIKPQLLEVQIDWSKIEEPYNNSPSSLLGMSGIGKEKTVGETLNKAPDDDKLPDDLSIEDDIVNQMYEALNVSGTPNSQQKTQGNKSNFRSE